MSQKNKADRENKAGETAGVQSYESQKDRWLKYGGNVALTILVVVALSVLAIYLGQTFKARKDTTAGQSHRLSDATVDLVQQLPSNVKLVSLYARREEEGSKPDVNAPSAAIRAQEVADLLDEYKNKSSKISVEVIDPYSEPAKVQQLFDEVSKKYGNNVNLYKDALEDFSKSVDEITKLIDQETKALKDIPKSKNQGLEMTLSLLRQTIDEFPDDLRELQSTLPAELNKTNPDYKHAAETARTKLGDLSRNLEAMVDGFKKAEEELKPKMDDLQHTISAQPPTTQPSADQQNLQTFQTFIAYAQAAEPRLTKIKKLADDLIGRLRNLGELKQLDELRDKKTDSIVVMGDKDMIVIPRNRVWREPAKDVRPVSGVKEKVRFAGEQEISTAMVVLTSPQRPRVTFVRSGGPPLTVQIENDQIGSYTGPYFAIAEKLREYNFEVLEKDLTDQWARQEMQMRMQMPDLRIPPEADKDQLAHSVWIVLPGREPNVMAGEPPSAIGTSLSDHLAAGGSAMVLFTVQDDGLSTALAPLGITANTGSIAAHSVPPETEGRVNDQVDEWRRQQAVWVINDLGSHPITSGLEKLDLMVVPAIPILSRSINGVTATKLLPLTDGSEQVWGKEIKQIHSSKITFDPKTDMNPPLYAGAAVEKTSGDAQHTVSRLVVFGGANFPINQWVELREKDVQRGGSDAARFPANSELFTNSVFWLSKMEKMMSIAPASRDVALIAPMSHTALSLWRTFMLAFVPLIVLLCGARIYFSRRD